MNQEEALQIVQDALEETLDGQQVNFSADTHLVNDGILDSLDAMVFIANIEGRTGKKFPEEDGEVDQRGLLKVENLVDFLCRP